MPWRAMVETNVALARILGVSQPAIVKAEARGRIEREVDGSWDVFRVVDDWRASTLASLQRRVGEFRPWLSNDTPLSPCIWLELERRARAEGADVFWEEDDLDHDDLVDNQDDDGASVR